MLNTEKFINKSKLKFDDKFDYSMVDYKNMKTNIKLICYKHGKFEITPHNHLRSKNGGCVLCLSDKIKNTDFIKDSQKIHGYKYDYSLVKYKNNITKVKIGCSVHGIFEQTPKNHLKGHICLKCSIEQSKLTLNEFILKSNIIHGNKYNYSKSNYKNTKTKVIIGCPIHGDFEQTPNSHLSGSGCVKCSIEQSKLTLNEFILKSNIVHDNKYEYTTYINSRTKTKIICPVHGIFEQTPSNHIQGSGCPICQESKGEMTIKLYLDENNIEYDRQKKFTDCLNNRHLSFDFYIPDYNLCIEYDGIQHFEPIDYFGGYDYFYKIKKRDKIKDDYCKNNKIRLVRIKYNKNIIFILKNILHYYFLII